MAGYLGQSQPVAAGGNSVETEDIQDGAVTEGKLGSGSVSTAKIADSAVTAAKIADGAAVPAQSGHNGKYLTTDGTTASWGTITNPTPTTVSDQDNTSTGYFDLPSGTTAQEPGNGAGRIRFDTDLGVVMFNDGAGWFKIAAQIAQLSSVSGTLYAGAASTLTLTGSGFLSSNLVVNFTQSSDSIDADVTVTPTSDTAASVTVPSSVYSNVTAGNSVSILVTNSDQMSSGAVTKSATALPSGGTITTSGGFRYHTFTSSGTFTNTLSNLSIEYLIVAGGGCGGASTGGGGGAGGAIDGSTTASTIGYSIVIGGGQAAGYKVSGTGSNSTAFGQTALGGGSGAWTESDQSIGSARSGGSGGGEQSYYGGSKSSGASGTSGQGNSGGGSTTSSRPGGGGGKTAAGQIGSGSAVGNGGSGINWKSLGTHYAGGGGGTNGTGGSGGGGNGINISGGSTPGSTNTGGGGGGGWGHSSDLGKSGGSGVVIIRYQI